MIRMVGLNSCYVPGPSGRGELCVLVELALAAALHPVIDQLQLPGNRNVPYHGAFADLP